MTAWLGMVALLAVAQSPLGLAPLGGDGDSVAVAVFPERPWIRPGQTARQLSFEFELANRSGRSVSLQRVVLSVLDATGGLVERRFLATHTAMSDGILTIPARDIPPDSAIGIFNPFHTFDRTVPLDRLRYEFGFDVAGGGQFRSTIEVRPEERATRTPLVLPLRDRALAYDADDFYSHHRRIDPVRGGLRRQGWADVPVRFAYDWAAVDPQGALWSGDPTRPENWHGYGAVVVAPGEGRIVAAENAVPDNRIADGRLVYPEGLSPAARVFGNHVFIDHGNGEVSQLAHLRAGSIRVAVGDSVRAGQPIAEVGFSGDTGFHVHVHHHVVAGASDGPSAARAVPLVFERFRIWRGGAWEPVGRGTVETGQIVAPEP